MSHDLKVQLTTLQASHKETLAQLADKAKHGAALKADLERAQNQNQALAEEVGPLGLFQIFGPCFQG